MGRRMAAAAGSGCPECKAGVLCDDARRLLRELIAEEAELVRQGAMTEFAANRAVLRLEEVGRADAARLVDGDDDA
jgi:hypothetical protein